MREYLANNKLEKRRRKERAKSDFISAVTRAWHKNARSRKKKLQSTYDQDYEAD